MVKLKDIFTSDIMTSIFYTILTSLLMSIIELAVFYIVISKLITKQITNNLNNISKKGDVLNAVITKHLEKIPLKYIPKLKSAIEYFKDNDTTFINNIHKTVEKQYINTMFEYNYVSSTLIILTVCTLLRIAAKLSKNPIGSPIGSPIGKNWFQNNILTSNFIINLFFMGFITGLFIHSTIVIFPTVSDKLYMDIIKKKYTVIKSFLKKEFHFDFNTFLINNLPNSSDIDPQFIGPEKAIQYLKANQPTNIKELTKLNKKQKKKILTYLENKRNDRNTSLIFNTISPFRWITYILLSLSIILVLYKLISEKIWIFKGSHAILGFLMILSFSTEVFIYKLVFEKYPYMPDFKLYHLITTQLAKILKNNKYLSDAEYMNTPLSPPIINKKLNYQSLRTYNRYSDSSYKDRIKKRNPR